MSKSRKHLKRRETSKKKTFKISTPRGITIIKSLDAQCAIIKAYKLARKRHHNRWAYLSKILKTPKAPILTEFKLTF